MESTKTDEQLLKSLREGDRDAEEQLYERYKRLINVRARSYFLIGAECNDLEQEGMIGCLRQSKNMIRKKLLPFTVLLIFALPGRC